MLRVAVVLAVAILAGCSVPYPPYKVSSVVQDPSLIGSWRVLDEDEAALEAAAEGEKRGDDAAHEEEEADPRGRFIKFEGRPVGVTGGHLEVGRADPDTFRDGKEHVVQYTVRYFDDGKEQDFAGYLLRVGDTELLGLQYDGPELADLGALVLPVHQFFRIEHEEKEEIELWAPSHPVAWLPQFEPADGPEDPDQPIPVREAPGGVYRLSASVDRVLAYYAAHAADEGFWSEDKIVLKWVENKGEEDEKE